MSIEMLLDALASVMPETELLAVMDSAGWFI